MIKRSVILSLVCLLLAFVSDAATRKNTSLSSPRYKSVAPVSHWLGVSANGVEANMLPGGKQIQVNAGGGGGGHLLYEIYAKGFFFNIGVGVDYIITNTAIDSYTDAFYRVDRVGEPLTYRYNYSDYREQQRQLRVIVPLQVGYQFGDYVYVGAGVAFRTRPLLNVIETSTRMYTQGEYERFIEPFRNVPSYGFWAEDTYTGSGKMLTTHSEIGIEAEVGSNIPLNVKWMRMRAGAFVGFDLPIIPQIDAEQGIKLVDYSAVDTYSLTQSQENLKENIRFNSMLDTSMVPDNAKRIRVGVKFTVLFDVTPKPKHCMCWK